MIDITKHILLDMTISKFLSLLSNLICFVTYRFVCETDGLQNTLLRSNKFMACHSVRHSSFEARRIDIDIIKKMYTLMNGLVMNYYYCTAFIVPREYFRTSTFFCICLV